VAKIRGDARAMASLVTTGAAREFLAAAGDLPAQRTRRLWHDATKTRYFTDAGRAALPAQERAALAARDVDEELYYSARWGTPVAYARALDLLAQGEDGFVGKRIFDFGFGAVGHLRMLASLGAHVVGVDVDPLSSVLYTAPGDQGTIRGRLGRNGDLRLVFGRFPADAMVVDAVGAGYDLFLSKNVLKRGYIHPERFASERHLITLGVDDEAFVRAIHAMLVSRGRALVYNLAPPPAPLDEPFIPWADGRCPFARDLWERVGFRVISFDRDDTPAARAMDHALGWDREPEAVPLTATYTLVEKMP
jgi:hypothetical protein